MSDEHSDQLELAKEKFEALEEENAKLKAEVERLREALDKLARLGNEPHYGNSVGNSIARSALEKEAR